ncbi:MAG: hypothetical protein IT427_00250 [Pirellulales bacterium]|nr:hypothetical protein [Pirellulales bacterium]
MSHLTYADRELLLRAFDSLRANWTGSDEQLLAKACCWAKEVIPALGFEHALLRDVAVLSKYLINHSKDVDLAEIARGGLLYLLQAGADYPQLTRFGLADDAFIASYAVHEIRTRLGDHAVYNPPALNKEEQEVAEQLFLELLERPVMEDGALVLAAQRVSKELAGLEACGLFRRLCNNLEFLSSVLRDSDRCAERRSYARAALSYVACEQDAIDDRLGIVDYLDDNFIAQLAVDLIEPAREPWLALLDATVGAWPFLNGMLIDDGNGGRPISEYMIVNSALACLAVQPRFGPGCDPDGGRRDPRTRRAQYGIPLEASPDRILVSRTPVV